MDLNSKKMLYKWGSISLNIINVFLILKCAFFNISESLTVALGLGSDSYFASVLSDSLQKALENAGHGKLTILDAQKIISAMGEISAFSDNDNSLNIFATIVYWLTILLVVCLIIEAIVHVFNGSFEYCAKGFDIFFILVVVISFCMFVKAGASFSPFGIASVVLPFVADSLWSRFLKIKENLQETMEEKDGEKEAHKAVSMNTEAVLFSSVKNGLQVSSEMTRILIAAIIVFYGSEVIFRLAGGYPTGKMIFAFFEAVLIGLALVITYEKDYMPLILLAILSVITKVIIFSDSLHILYVSQMIFHLGSSTLVCLLVFLFHKCYSGKYSLLINTGITIATKAFIFPTISLGYFTYNEYITFGNIVSSTHSIAITIGILLPPVIFGLTRLRSLETNISDKSFENSISAKSSNKTTAEKQKHKSLGKERIGNVILNNEKEVYNLQKQIKEKMHERSSLFYTLGKKYYNKKNPDSLSIENNEIFSLYAKIQQLEKENVGINDRIDELRNIFVCPSCGKENQRDSRFCYNCGTKLKQDSNS